MRQQNLRKMSKLVFLLFVLLWMALIFIFSSQPYESQEIRKSAFVTEYTVLGILIFQTLRMIFPRVWGNSLISISLCYLYAVTDEYHQAFIVNRSPLFTDVLLDTGEATAGILFFMFISKVISILYQKKFRKVSLKRE
jgi:VanZ family protein